MRPRHGCAAKYTKLRRTSSDTSEVIVASPVGKYELKKSTENVDYLKEKLEPRKLQAKHHLAHVVNRMFTTLETKGIARPATEEFMLSAEYNEHDPLSAEFIRTCDHYDFFGGAFLTRVESAMTSKSVFNQGGGVCVAASTTSVRSHRLRVFVCFSAKASRLLVPLAL